MSTGHGLMKISLNWRLVGGPLMFSLWLSLASQRRISNLSNTVPSIHPSYTCMENFKQINEICREISLFKKYVKNVKLSQSRYAYLVSVHGLFYMCL